MAYDQFTCFKVKVESGIARVTLDYAPLNLLDEVMSSEFTALTHQLEHDNDVRVVILQSALPEFFIAHSGLARVASGAKEVSGARNFRLTQIIGETIRSMPKVTIAQVEGRCRGGGNEIAMACDMCFGALGSAIFGQPEVGFGLVPGGGATQRLPRLMGRARALEVLLTGQDFSAEDAERMGFINRALPAAELGAYVDNVATNIARLPIHTIRHIKQSVDKGAFGSISEGLLVEAQNADECMTSEVTRDRVKQAMALGVETKEVELNVISLLDKMK
jgi:enoyl-CoA hydratase/carnithine racemase